MQSAPLRVAPMAAAATAAATAAGAGAFGEGTDVDDMFEILVDWEQSDAVLETPSKHGANEPTRKRAPRPPSTSLAEAVEASVGMADRAKQFESDKHSMKRQRKGDWECASNDGSDSNADSSTPSTEEMEPFEPAERREEATTDKPEIPLKEQAIETLKARRLAAISA